MRMLSVVCFMVAIAFIVASGTNFAQEKKKEVVLKGKICCNKCELNKSTECETVIVVKDAKSKKDVVYFFDKDGHGKFHDDICSAAKNGTVTGTVKDVEKKKVVAVKKVAYD